MPTVFELNRAEQLIVWAARRWMHGRFRWSEVEREFVAACGQDYGITGSVLLDQMLDLLQRRPGPPPLVANGSASRLDFDERRLLTALALLQDGQAGPATTLMRWMAGPPDRAELLAVLEQLAAVLPPLGQRFLAPPTAEPPSSRRPSMHRTGVAISAVSSLGPRR